MTIKELINEMLKLMKKYCETNGKDLKTFILETACFLDGNAHWLAEKGEV